MERESDIEQHNVVMNRLPSWVVCSVQGFAPEIRFATALARTLNVVANCEIEGVLEIDKTRNVSTTTNTHGTNRTTP